MGAVFFPSELVVQETQQQPPAWLSCNGELDSLPFAGPPLVSPFVVDETVELAEFWSTVSPGANVITLFARRSARTNRCPLESSDSPI